MSITTQVLLTLFATLGSPTEELTNVCDIVHPKTGTPTICEPHPEGAPVYDDVVCCDSQLCFEPDEQGCLEGEQPLYCELGDVGEAGVVSCYFEVLDFCDVFSCEPGYQAQPQAMYMCCNQGICWTSYGPNDCEPQDIYWCDDGVTNQDGTVTCFD